MIRLTRRSGEIEIVNPDRIERIVEAHADSGARIIFPSGESYSYKESPEEVARKVLEWRLEMERYKAYMEGIAFDEDPQSGALWEFQSNLERKLKVLAGLEE